MTSSPSFILLLLSLGLLLVPARGGEETNTLELVQMLYRHGDRSPITHYPNDPYNITELWPEGLGQLTKRGKQMQYHLGRWLRARYGDFISPSWVPEEVTIRSTDCDRTLMSATCNLASFYYPEEENERFENDLPWLPTPIHTVPFASDKLLSVDQSCPRVEEVLKEQEELPEVKNVTLAYQDLFRYLTNKSGIPITNVSSAGYLIDTLYIESLYNYTLPNWTEGLWPQFMFLRDYSFQLVAYTKEMKRLRAGPLIKELGDHMSKKATGELPKAKLFMYSGHDTTVSALLLGLGVFNNLAPPYAATVLLELHKVQEKRFVKMFLRNDTAIKDPPHLLRLPGCSDPCHLEDWLELTAKMVPLEWDKECKSSHHAWVFSDSMAAYSVAGILAILLLLLAGYNLTVWCQRDKHFAYQAVPSSIS